jgi:hypothetical protein
MGAGDYGVYWDRVDVGTVMLPAGASTITLTRNTQLADVYVKSLELVQESALAARNTRIANARANTTWFSDCPYGLMFQYGSWGFPNNVGTAKSLNQQAADFNVAQFVSMVQNTGASYVVWSISWWGFHVDAPINEINSIVTAAGGPANPGLTSNVDLIGNIAAALKAVGIRFMLYYHTGDEDTGWWPYQSFPTSFSANGSGDRSTFFAHWRTVVEAIGNRYGTNLDGFFFDDGIIYYPAPFEALEASARAGNPNRLISWNNSTLQLPRLTDFQDVFFGERGPNYTNKGGISLGSSPVGGDGVYTAGPQVGLLQHGMFTLDTDWGIHSQNQKIAPNGTTSANLISWVSSASSRGVPLTLDLMMYEDGTLADVDLAAINDLRQAIHGTVEPVPTGTVMVNDTDAAITYTGTWTHATGRGSGDYSDDVHWTATVGNSFSYTFTGTGIDVLGPKSNVSGNFTVTVDGVLIGTFSQYAASGYQAQAVLYSARHLAAGSHTIKLTMQTGRYLQLDSLRVVPNPRTINDNDPSITYSGGWTRSTGRGVGDYGDDLHWTKTNGASATIAFTGTGIDLIGPMEPTDGTASVTLDGVAVSTIKATYSGSYSPQQHYLGFRNLAAGPHTVVVTKTGGQYLQLDAAVIWP